MNSLTINN